MPDDLAAVFSQFSRQLVQLAVASGWATMAAAVGFLAFILVLRIVYLVRDARERATRNRWAVFFAERFDAPPGFVPVPKWGERETVLDLYLHLRRRLKGPEAAQIDALARRAGFGETAWELLRGRRIDRKLRAIQTLGYLKTASAWEALRTRLADTNPALSLAALESMFRIDPERAVGEMLSRIGAREDWSDARLAACLREAGPRANTALAARVAEAGPNATARLVRFLEFVDPVDALRIARSLLDGPVGRETAVAALHIVKLRGGADDRARLRTLLAGDDWVIRLSAVAALGNLGEAEDVSRLEALLSDREWWVRYRSAQALLKLPGAGRARAEALAAGHTDRFARDILRQVLAEQRGGAA